MMKKNKFNKAKTIISDTNTYNSLRKPSDVDEMMEDIDEWMSDNNEVNNIADKKDIKDDYLKKIYQKNQWYAKVMSNELSQLSNEQLKDLYDLMTEYTVEGKKEYIMLVNYDVKEFFDSVGNLSYSETTDNGYYTDFASLAVADIDMHKPFNDEVDVYLYVYPDGNKEIYLDDINNKYGDYQIVCPGVNNINAVLKNILYSSYYIIDKKASKKYIVKPKWASPIREAKRVLGIMHALYEKNLSK